MFSQTKVNFIGFDAKRCVREVLFDVQGVPEPQLDNHRDSTGGIKLN
jgi:hypothetical protein